jgi:hypothetical protein
MKYKGVTYDVGTEYYPSVFTRDFFEISSVISDMEAIRNKLHCNSIRIYGKEVPKLLMAAEIALNAGLNVWLSPRLINGDEKDTLNYLKVIAAELELLKQKYPDQELILIIGGELTLDMKGFLPGNTIHARITNLAKPFFFLKNALGIKPRYQQSFDRFLKEAAAVVRKEFTGKITYAAAMWEKVDCSDFDFNAMNFYKASFNRSFYNKKLKQMVAKGKPVIITEFGCCTYQGAENKGPSGYSVLDWSTTPPSFKVKCIRDEKVQADYLIDLLNTYDHEKVTGAFIFDFYSQIHTYSSDPDKDYDMASFGITKSIGNHQWEAKESFYRVADYYKVH